MDEPFQAVYEHGILRPLVPLSLKEDEVVSLCIVCAENGESKPTELAERVRKQREALAAFVKKLESLPDESPRDGLSNRDHDGIIYGP